MINLIDGGVILASLTAIEAGLAGVDVPPGGAAADDFSGYFTALPLGP